MSPSCQDVVARFKSQGDTQKHLEDLKKENAKHLQRLQEEKSKLQQEYEEMKYSGEAKLSRFVHFLNRFVGIMFGQGQRSQTRVPRATCGPRGHLRPAVLLHVRPAVLFGNFQMINISYLVY